jgi:hypothetical protein
MATYTNQYSLWPTCAYSVSVPQLSFSIVEGDSWGDHSISFATESSAAFSDYCPTFTGEVDLYRNGEKIHSAAMNASTMNAFYGTGNTETVKSNFNLDFNDGLWCAIMTMTPSAAKPGEEVVTKTSGR